MSLLLHGIGPNQTNSFGLRIAGRGPRMRSPRSTRRRHRPGPCAFRQEEQRHHRQPSGKTSKESLIINRDDLPPPRLCELVSFSFKCAVARAVWASTSNKQLIRQLPDQHIFTILKQLATGRVRPSADTAVPPSCCRINVLTQSLPLSRAFAQPPRAVFVARFPAAPFPADRLSCP